MVAHEAIGVHLPPGLLTRFRQGFDEIVTVNIVDVYIFTPISAAHDVIHGARIFDPQHARHVAVLLPPDACSQGAWDNVIADPFPFHLLPFSPVFCVFGGWYARETGLNKPEPNLTLGAMTVEAIKDAVHTSPFRPFTVRLANGARIEIDQEQRIGIHPEGKTFVVFQKGGGYRIVDIPLVAELIFR